MAGPQGDAVGYRRHAAPRRRSPTSSRGCRMPMFAVRFAGVWVLLIDATQPLELAGCDDRPYGRRGGARPRHCRQQMGTRSMSPAGSCGTSRIRCIATVAGGWRRHRCHVGCRAAASTGSCRRCSRPSGSGTAASPPRQAQSLVEGLVVAAAGTNGRRIGFNCNCGHCAAHRPSLCCSRQAPRLPGYLTILVSCALPRPRSLSGAHPDSAYICTKRNPYARVNEVGNGESAVGSRQSGRRHHSRPVQCRHDD